jgi:hypothetical protein
MLRVLRDLLSPKRIEADPPGAQVTLADVLARGWFEGCGQKVMFN